MHAIRYALLKRARITHDLWHTQTKFVVYDATIITFRTFFKVTSSSEYDVCNDEFSSRGDDSDQDLDIFLKTPSV